MKVNESGIDRIIRAVAGAGLLAFTGVATRTWGTVLTVLGFLGLVTGAVGICPLYALLKVRTNNA